MAYIFQVPEKQFIRNSRGRGDRPRSAGAGLPDEEVERGTVGSISSRSDWRARDASPYVLSHGQKRRLSVACMVVRRPDVVVLDATTFGQDPRQNLMDSCAQFADSGAAVVFITHDMRWSRNRRPMRRAGGRAQGNLRRHATRAVRGGRGAQAGAPEGAAHPRLLQENF